MVKRIGSRLFVIYIIEPSLVLNTNTLGTLLWFPNKVSYWKRVLWTLQITFLMIWWEAAFKIEALALFIWELYNKNNCLWAVLTRPVIQGIRVSLKSDSQKCFIIYFHYTCCTLIRVIIFRLWFYQQLKHHLHYIKRLKIMLILWE